MTGTRTTFAILGVAILTGCASMSARSGPEIPAADAEALDGAVTRLVAIVEDGDARQRLQAAVLLGRIGSLSPRTVPSTLDILRPGEGMPDDLDHPVFRQIETLGAPLPEAGPDPAYEMISMPRSGAYLPALLALSSMDPGAAPQLREASRDESCIVRWAAVHALGGVDPVGEETAEVLGRRIRDDCVPVQRLASSMLLEIGAAARPASPHLRKAARSDDPRTRLLATLVLVELGSPPSDAVWTLALHIGRDEPLALRVACMAGLGRLGDAAAPVVPVLVALAAGPTHPLVLRAEASTALVRITPAVEGAFVEALAAPDVDMRVVAALALGRTSGGRTDEGGLHPGLVEPLVRAAVAVHDPGLRVIALETLAGIGPEAHESVEAIVAALLSGHPRVARAAVGALTSVAQPGTEGSAAMAAMLDSPDPMIRAAAAALLAFLGPEAIPLLLPAVDDPDPQVSQMARASLHMVARSQPGEMILQMGLPADIELDWAGGADLGAVVADATPLLEHPSPDVRAQAASVLGWMGGDAEEAVPALVASLGDEKPQVARAAAEALGAIGEPAVPALVQILETDGEPDVRRGAMVALGTMGEGAADAVPALVALLDHEDHDTRAHAADALGRMGEAASPAVPHLEALLDDEFADVRMFAAWALGTLGPVASGATGGLLAHASDEDEDVRAMIAWSLGEVGAARGDVVDALVAALDDPFEDVRYEAIEALGARGESSARSAGILAGILDGGDATDREVALSALEDLGPEARPALDAVTSLLDSGDEDTRVDALAVLSSMGPEALDAAPEVIALLAGDDGGTDVACPAAATALPSPGPWSPSPDADHESFLLGEPIRLDLDLLPALPPPRGASCNPQTDRVARRASEALASMGPPILPLLCEALGSDDRLTRVGALRALEYMGPDAAPALDAITRALDDPSPPVRAAAADGLASVAISPAGVLVPLVAHILDEDPDAASACFESAATLLERWREDIGT